MGKEPHPRATAAPLTPQEEITAPQIQEDVVSHKVAKVVQAEVEIAHNAAEAFKIAAAQEVVLLLDLAAIVADPAEDVVHKSCFLSKPFF